jgi:thiol-disulfide isomerase/thioredoxin
MSTLRRLFKAASAAAVRGALASAALGLCCAFIFSAASGATAPPPKAKLTSDDLQRLAAQAADSTTARGAATELRRYLASGPDSVFVPFARVMVVEALLSCRAPQAELEKAMDDAEKALPDKMDARVSFYASLARALSERGIATERALRYANKAVEICPTGADNRQLRSMALSSLGEVQLQTGHAADAAISLAKAVPDSPDSQTVLSLLGQAHEKNGKPELAIEAYVRSAAVFAGRDTSAMKPLRALWIKTHGSLAGLDAKLTSARAVSLKQVALDAHRIQSPRPAPAWRLPDLNENVHDIQSYKGRVLVMDFWGSWCGPCRQELPLIEATHQRYSTNAKVAFVGINWERAEGAEEHRTLARDFVAKNHLTFPMMYDHEHVAVSAYSIQGFPTVFVIDREGIVRYVNIGFDPHVSEIISAQIESLLE